MTPRQKRFAVIAGGTAGLALAIGLVLYALNSNIVFFYTPTDVAENKVPADRTFRIGGMVQEGSVRREGTRVSFVVTDMLRTVPVSYTGTLPDLFREGQGVVAQGQLDNRGGFTASEVLAKHDENYMPPEAAEAMKRAREAKAAGQPVQAMPSYAGHKPEPATAGGNPQ